MFLCFNVLIYSIVTLLFKMILAYNNTLLPLLSRLIQSIFLFNIKLNVFLIKVMTFWNGKYVLMLMYIMFFFCYFYFSFFSHQWLMNYSVILNGFSSLFIYWNKFMWNDDKRNQCQCKIDIKKTYIKHKYIIYGCIIGIQLSFEFL